jgi:hypothetical protein
MFQVAFIENFLPANEATIALLCLESNHFYKGKRIIDEYLDEFKTLVCRSGYKEKLGIVMKFQRSLNVINSPISLLSLMLAVMCYLFILSIHLSDTMKIHLSRLIIDQLWNRQAFEHIPITLITRSPLGVPQHNSRAFETHACYLTRQVATTTPWKGL